MTSLIIAFLCGSLACLIICFAISILTADSRQEEVTAALEEARRRAYARGYEEGNLHGRGHFIDRHHPSLRKG
jgi:hypothetical protein